jgi:hypothetical protein
VKADVTQANTRVADRRSGMTTWFGRFIWARPEYQGSSQGMT